MDRLTLRFIYSVSTLIPIVLGYYFITRDTNSPKLDGMLSTVTCYNPPVDAEHAKRNRALMTFDSYALYFVCLDEQQIQKKHLLKCETENMSRPLCGNEATLTQYYSLTKNGDTYDVSHYEDTALPIVSSVSYRFSQSGFKPNDNKAHEEQYHFGKDDLVYADKFEFHEDFVCDSVAYSLNSAFCHASLSYNDLDIGVHVALVGKNGTTFDKNDARRSVQHWVKLLNEIVQPVDAEDS